MTIAIQDHYETFEMLDPTSPSTMTSDLAPTEEHSEPIRGMVQATMLEHELQLFGPDTALRASPPSMGRQPNASSRDGLPPSSYGCVAGDHPV